MKVRAMCAAGLIAAAAVPATASAGTTIKKRLHRADVALNKALDAADDGNDARVISGLKGANRQTNLALKSTLRLVVRDRRDADRLRNVSKRCLFTFPVLHLWTTVKMLTLT